MWHQLGVNHPLILFSNFIVIWLQDAGRTALLMAIDNENLEMVVLLLENKVWIQEIKTKVETKDALLHAINEEYVEAVEVLLDHEESIHKEGELWVKIIIKTFFLFFFTELVRNGWCCSKFYARHFPADPCCSYRQLWGVQDSVRQRGCAVK